MTTAADLAKAFRRFERALADLEVKVSEASLREAADASHEMERAHHAVWLASMTRARKSLGLGLEGIR